MADKDQFLESCGKVNCHAFRKVTPNYPGELGSLAQIRRNLADMGQFLPICRTSLVDLGQHLAKVGQDIGRCLPNFGRSRPKP